MAKDRRDYEVGKGKPPKWTRFKKGEPSPNPNGRPRKKVTPIEPAQGSADEILRRELGRKVTITDADGQRQVSKLEAIQLAQIRAGLLGSPVALRDLQKAIRDIETQEAALAQQQKEAEEAFYEKVVRFKALRRQIWNAAEANGVEPENPWPHPDDVIINTTNRTWRIRGALSAADLPYCYEFRARRDVAIFDAVHACMDHDNRAEIRKVIAKLYLIAAVQCDAELPKRWQVRHRLPDVIEEYWLLPDRRLKTLEAQARAELESWMLVNGTPKYDKEVRRETERLMKPLLTLNGFRSLAHLEHVCGERL